METVTLQAEVREGRKKGPARRLREQGKIPGVFYGPGVKPTPLTLLPDQIIRALRSERGRNVVFRVSVHGEEQLAMVKDLSTDPVTHELLHVDLYRVFEHQAIEVRVPFRTVGRAVGVIRGGMLNVTRRALPLRATPANIPASVEVDVTALQLNDTISVKNIQLPEGIECTLRPDLTLVVVVESRKKGAQDVAEQAELQAMGDPGLASAGS